jgi:hypothetical protein
MYKSGLNPHFFRLLAWLAAIGLASLATLYMAERWAQVLEDLNDFFVIFPLA